MPRCRLHWESLAQYFIWIQKLFIALPQKRHDDSNNSHNKRKVWQHGLDAALQHNNWTGLVGQMRILYSFLTLQKPPWWSESRGRQTKLQWCTSVEHISLKTKGFLMLIWGSTTQKDYINLSELSVIFSQIQVKFKISFVTLLSCIKWNVGNGMIIYIILHCERSIASAVRLRPHLRWNLL